MRRKIAIIISFIAILSFVVFEGISYNQAHAQKAQIYLEIPDSIKKENEFTVKVVVDSDIELYSIDAYLTYDVNMLEFVPDNEKVSGTSGILEIRDIYGEKTKRKEYQLTFKALETGKTKLALSDVYLVDYVNLEDIEVSPTTGNIIIEVNSQVTKDASLEDLLVAPGDLTEEFSPDCLEYEVHVGLDVEKIGVSAILADEDSVVELDMPEQLAEGENLVVITVTALSGNVKTYTVKVIRKEWPEEEGTEPAAEELEETETEMPEESETTAESLTASEIE